MTTNPDAPLPDAGGSYVRDPDTGTLQPVPDEAAALPVAPPPAKPATKPVKEA